MSEALWYYEDGGKQAGPIGDAAMAEAIRAGRLAAGCRVWRAGLAGWLPWESIPELSALRPQPPAAPPGGPPPLAPPAPPAAQPWGPPPGGAGAGAPFPGNSYAAEVLASGAQAIYEKAPLGARFVAFILDGLISMVPAGLLGAATAGAFVAGSTGLGVALAVALAVAFAWALYYSFTKDGRPNGQSIGKKTMGLMVVHLPTNQPCSKGQSAIRYLVLFGLNLIPYVGWLVEPIVTLSAAGGLRLGDKAAATQVIAVGAYQPRR